jgi:hypothetical protein
MERKTSTLENRKGAAPKVCLHKYTFSTHSMHHIMNYLIKYTIYTISLTGASGCLGFIQKSSPSQKL